MIRVAPKFRPDQSGNRQQKRATPWLRRVAVAKLLTAFSIIYLAIGAIAIATDWVPLKDRLIVSSADTELIEVSMEKIQQYLVER
jgi:hypothetical protein